MTTSTHTVAAILFATGTQLVKLATEHKKVSGEPLFHLSTDLGNGVTYRELKHWMKEFKAKQSEVVVAAKASEKPAPKPDTRPTELRTVVKPANKLPAAAVELKAKDVIDQIVLIGRAKETVLRVVRDTKLNARVALTDKGSRILFSYIERNNRGNLRVKPGTEQMAVKTADAIKASKVVEKVITSSIKAADKAPAKVAANKPAPVKAAANKPMNGARVLKIQSSNLMGAAYDKDAKVLTVTFKNGAVWDYKGVTIREVKALESAVSQGAHFIETIKSVKDAHCVTKGTPRAKKV